MATLPELMNFNAMQTIQAGEAGRRRRTLYEIGGFAGSGDLRGAEAAAWRGGEPEWAMRLKKHSQEDQARTVEAAARFAMGANDEASWNAGAMEFERQHPGFKLPPFAAKNALISQAIPVLNQWQARREDARYAQSRAEAVAAAGSKPPEVETFYDEQTGLETKRQWNPQTRSWEAIGGVKAPSGTSLNVDPATGAVSFQQGQGVGGKALTEGQSKDAVYATRAAGALPLIQTYGNALTNLPQSFVGSAPVVGNYFRDADYQRADQAGKEFLQAILRKDTGAAITKEETAEYGSVYLPQPGDRPEVLAQKAQSRDRALQAIMAGMPPQAILNAERALGATLPASPGMDQQQPPRMAPPSIGGNGGSPGMPLPPSGKPAPQGAWGMQQPGNAQPIESLLNKYAPR